MAMIQCSLSNEQKLVTSCALCFIDCAIKIQGNFPLSLTGIPVAKLTSGRFTGAAY